MLLEFSQICTDTLSVISLRCISRVAQPIVYFLRQRRGVENTMNLLCLAPGQPAMEQRAHFIDIALKKITLNVSLETDIALLSIFASKLQVKPLNERYLSTASSL
jgi:hypothetical protein